MPHLFAASLTGLVILVSPLTIDAPSTQPSPPIDELVYPDLRAQPPSQLLPAIMRIDGIPHHVLRFTAAIANLGPGPLELRGSPAAGRTRVVQRIGSVSGETADVPVGTFVYHPAHQHWHFEHFASYELWTRAAYDQWLASGRVAGTPTWQGSKTTGGDGGGESFCLRDNQPVPDLTPEPVPAAYFDCDSVAQGISVGWLDVYSFDLPEQWIDIGPTPLSDGEYVLRVVADPQNLIRESSTGTDVEKEDSAANEGVTAFSIQKGCLAPALLALPLQTCRDPA